MYGDGAERHDARSNQHGCLELHTVFPHHPAVATGAAFLFGLTI
jgi:hypothetical protein